jgi:hypothetical protein
MISICGRKDLFERATALPNEKRERAMIEQPDIKSYSMRASICLGVAIFGAARLVAGG